MSYTVINEVSRSACCYSAFKHLQKSFYVAALTFNTQSNSHSYDFSNTSIFKGYCKQLHIYFVRIGGFDHSGDRVWCGHSGDRVGED